MSLELDPDLDLAITRIIRAPRTDVWNAWADPTSFEQWWVPAPYVCKVREMDLWPGGSFLTELVDDDEVSGFSPHITGSFLAVDHLERIVYTDCLVAGWRPAESAFVTGVVTMADHPDGTEYVAVAKHRNRADRDKHEELGFHEGWGMVAQQLAEFVESRV